MKEYWVNVYYYPKLKKKLYSHNISTREHAIELSSLNYSIYLKSTRKTLYRIHVKMK